MNNKQLRLSTAAVLATSVALTAMPTSDVQAATKLDSATINTKATSKVPTYKDVPVTANYYEAVEALSKQKLINGYADKTFKPNAKITRGQIAKILSRMLDLKTTKKTKFTDLPSSHEFYEVANAVVVAGYMSPDSKGKFNTKSYLTREEYADILTKAFSLQTKSNTLPFKDFNSKYKNSIQAVYDHRIMRG
ncbi:MAG: S-layer homology domain-containing protein, partial [Lysinibacillus sp.]